MSKKIVVVGSGFGGLSAAIRLQAQGNAVTLIEKLDKPGGRAYVYQDSGFTFDAGPTVITAPHCIEELFTVAGRKMADYVELIPVSPFYRLFWEDGYRFDYSNDLEATLKQIRERSPEDEGGYLRFLKYSEEVFKEGYVKLAHVPFLNWWKMLEVAPQLIKLRADRSVYKTVSRFVKNPHLREAFSFHSLLVGGNPFETSSIYTLIHFLERKWGVLFPRGGTGALVQALVRLFEEIGGKVLLNTEVQQICTVKGKVVGVRVSDGNTLPAEAVISNADVMHTYKQMLSDEPRARIPVKKLENRRYSMSLFLIYFGTKVQYPQLAHHNVIFGPRYRALLDDIFSNGILPDDFSLYLHAPTRSDPGMAPPGCESFYVLSPVGHLGNLDLDWSVEGPRYAERILKYLESKYLPGLRANIVTQRIFTPKDFETKLNSHLGSAFSLEPILTQSAYFRVHNRDSAIDGLFFVGAGTHPGAGLPGVINSGKATAKLVSEHHATH